MSVEEELIEATGFEPTVNYASRQDYLAALARAVSKMSEDDYELISDEAAAWYEDAFKAIKAKDEIPDFDDADEDEEMEEDVEFNGEAADEDELLADEEELELQAAEEVPEPEPEPVQAPKPKKAKAKKEKKSVVNKNPSEPTNPEDYERLSGEKDRFGVYEGTKVSRAVAMYARGTTAKELNEVLGGRYYNILTRLAKEGHKVIKEGGVITLIHKDDFGKGAKG